MTAGWHNRQSPSTDDDVDWIDQAQCHHVDPDLFFPERGASVKEAKAVCDACPVQAQCLEYALRNKIEHGIWGGMSERERKPIRRHRARANA